jgi:LCP family protein required for cell wall assembly
MDKESIPSQPKKIKPSRKVRIIFVVLTFILLLLIGLFSVFSFYLHRVFNIGPKQFYSYVQQFFSSPEQFLTIANDRTNILLLGVSGEDHQGSDLTDTMIFISTNVNSADSVMMSIPRDIWVPSMQTKINAIYHYGNDKSEKKGFTSLATVFTEIFGQPINYFVLLDFEAFHDLIDIVGGVDILVERSFDDYRYPIPGKENDECNGDPEYGCRYEHLHFERGLLHMDGEQALKFVRSRNAEGEEGTDFARSQRQQKVILALKDAITNPQLLFSPGKLEEIYQTIINNTIVYPELSKKEQMGFVKLGYKFWRNKRPFRTLDLETGDDDNPGFLTSPPVEKYGQWVLEPIDADWEKVKEFINKKIKGGY